MTELEVLYEQAAAHLAQHVGLDLHRACPQCLGFLRDLVGTYQLDGSLRIAGP